MKREADADVSIGGSNVVRASATGRWSGEDGGAAKAMALPVEVERKEVKEERKKAEMKLRTLLLALKVGGVKGDFFQRYLDSQTPAGPNDTAAPTRTLHHEWLDAKRACSCWYVLAGRCGW